MQAKDIINKLVWIDALVNNDENKNYQNMLKTRYGLEIFAYDNAGIGIKALGKFQFESIFVITSGTIYPEFFAYMKRTFKELRVIPFSIIFTSSANAFINKHKYDEIGKLYNKTFYNRGGVVDSFNGVIAFIEEIYSNLNAFQTIDTFKGIYTKNYSGLIVFEKVFQNLNLNLPYFYKDIFYNKHIDNNELNYFTKFFLTNFCSNKYVEKLLKPLILFKEVPEEIISKYWARAYTYETPFYSVMNKSLMIKAYKIFEIYIKLLYKGLALKSYYPKLGANLTRGTKLELSEINFLKSIAGTNQIIYNKSFLSFSLNKQFSIEFEKNCDRSVGLIQLSKKSNQPKILNGTRKPKKKGLGVLIEVSNISVYEQNQYMISNAFLYDISYYTKEEEVLIFPFTGFEVTSWENYDFIDDDGNVVEGTYIKMKFSKNYFDLIKKIYGNYY